MNLNPQPGPGNPSPSDAGGDLNTLACRFAEIAVRAGVGVMDVYRRGATVRTKADATVANLEAIGENEAVLLCDEPMPRGRPVLVKASSRVFRARVAGCRRDEIVPGYRVLVAFCGQFQWDKRMFSPQHLIDMKELGQQNEMPAMKTMTAGHACSAGFMVGDRA